MPRTTESLETQLRLALAKVLSNATGEFTSHDDGYVSAPDVPGFRVRLEVEGRRVAAPSAPTRERARERAKDEAAAAVQLGLFDGGRQ